MIFKNSIGRTDLPGGDYKTLINSIKKRLFFKSQLITTKKTRFIEKSHSHLKKLFEIYEMKDDYINKKIETY